MQMDFECGRWDVSGEAAQLASNLFVESAQRQKKRRKRKHKDSPSSDQLVVAGVNTAMGSKKKKKNSDGTTQVVKNSDGTKHDEMLKHSTCNRKTKFDTNPGLKKGDITGKRSIENTFDKNVCSPKKKLKSKKNETNDHNHNGSNKKSSKEVDTDISSPNQESLPLPSEVKIKKKKKTAEVEACRNEKQQNTSSEVNKHNVSQETGPINHSEGESTTHNTDETKKKRKRKCKKNKFKDYTKDVTQTDTNGSGNTSNLNGQKISQTCGTKEAINDKDASIQSKDVNGSETKKRRKKKKKNLDNNEGMSPPVDKSGSQSGKTKPKFDVAKLNALLSAKEQGGQSISNVSENKKDSHNESDKSITEVNMKDSKSGQKSLLEKSRERLNAARFRYLNEQLYTSTGKEALQLFRKDREAFSVYHEGFQGQVEKWPANPVDVIIKQIKTKPKKLVVADFGCGDAKIAQSVGNKVHSFDLVALNDHVTVCDISKVPLDSGSVDIAVFCLSLMGTNLSSYLLEANRVLKHGGSLMVAEVTSRFDNPGRFALQVEKMGFKIRHQDNSNKMFVLMDFKKTSQGKSGNTEEIHLKPCVYKKR